MKGYGYDQNGAFAWLEVEKPAAGPLDGILNRATSWSCPALPRTGTNRARKKATMPTTLGFMEEKPHDLIKPIVLI